VSGWEGDPVEEALTRFYRATAATVVTPDVEVIVRRAQRQRSTNALVITAVIVAVVAAIAAAGPLRRNRALPPANPSPTVSEPVGETRVDPAERILAGFVESPLLRDTYRDPAAEPFESRDGGVLTGECAGGPVDRLTVVRAAGDDDARVDISLYLYESESAARGAFARVSTGLRSCLGFAGAALGQTSWPSYGDASKAMTFQQPPGDAAEFAGGQRHAVAVRVGRAVEVFTSGPAHGRSPARPLAAATPEELDAIVAASLPRLCLFTSGGCSPAPGLPAPVDTLTRDEDTWLLAVRVFQSDDKEARPGTALAVAAEAGYHPIVVRQGCDVGGDFAVPEDALTARYLALYFRQRSQADAVAAELAARVADGSGAALQVRAVQARCVS
jgi:hypothetical protein